MKDRYRYHLLLFVGISMLISCSPFKPAAMTDASGELPDAYSLYSGEPDASSPWWESVGSPELSRLINTARSDSFTLKEAWARLQQARSLAIQAGAALYPDLAATGSVEYARRRSKTTSGGSAGGENYAVGLVSSYEIDLWGRVRSQREAALLDVGASQADLHTATVTVAAEVADRWVRIISQRLQKQLLEKQLENNLTFLELIELRFRKAMVSALDVYQQKQVVENVLAKIPLVEAETQLLMHELAMLLGRPPRADLGLTQTEMPVIGRLPAVGLPADLLANRPDVRAAGMRLKAAEWQVAAARANRLPALQFTAGAQYGRSDLDLLFDTWLLSLAANLTAPIFDGGRRAAEVDHTRAQADENLWAYRRTVLTAVKEVEDAIESETRQREHIKGLEAVKAAARKGLEEAIWRYRNGLSDYLPVLTQLLAVQDLERNLISQQELLILYRVGLHRALGGGWLADAGHPEVTAGAITQE
ncbi:MAG: efflux transporter outer membrane subunit [Desulfosarcina sp.]|nr:efflux transporter outer membrane subunit [Desulfosarcina sp.]MBC2741745.1 efflux transporter outer membrane subunit [Desulfosarcina sp.]MBC2764659.1 efflux transporter outer membrane subunit [Desulfosarcina sp.]